MGGVGLLAGLPGADLLVDAGALWILLGQVPRPPLCFDSA